MKKNIFLLSASVLLFFISACGTTDDDGIFAGSECTFEGSEICSDNGVDILLCQSSTWTVKKQCNISIGKKCRQGSDGTLGCFGEGESNGNYGNNDEHDNTDISDSEEFSDTEDGEMNYSNDADTDTENPDNENDAENSNNAENDKDTDDSESEHQTDPEPDTPDDAETPDNDSGDTGNIPDNDTDSDTDSGEPETPAGQCSSNSDCSGSTPYCSISTSQCIANAVFITEYVEGSSENKAIEIYNGSKSSVNLGNFTIQQANNGKDWGSDANFIYSFTASTAIPSGGIFVFCNVASDTELVAKCDQTPTSSVFKFNGDDGIALFNGTSVVDQIGNAMEQTNWSVAGVSSATKDHTLRRKTSVIQGTTDWAVSAGTTAENSQWEVLAQDTFDGLGQR